MMSRAGVVSNQRDLMSSRSAFSAISAALAMSVLQDLGDVVADRHRDPLALSEACLAVAKVLLAHDEGIARSIGPHVIVRVGAEIDDVLQRAGDSAAVAHE